MAAGGEGRAALRDLLIALVKVALAPDAREASSWRTEAVDAQRLVAGGSDDRDGTKLDDVWTAATARARADPAVRRGETVNPTLPMTCPLVLDDLAGPGFDLDGALAAIRGTASFG